MSSGLVPTKHGVLVGELTEGGREERREGRREGANERRREGRREG